MALVAEDGNIQVERGVMVEAATDTGFFAGVAVADDLPGLQNKIVAEAVSPVVAVKMACIFFNLGGEHGLGEGRGEELALS